jgi:two-component system phosphate regulon sensor histidine kinase PhoR
MSAHEHDTAAQSGSSEQQLERLRARVSELEGQLEEMDGQMRELENEAAQRGVKLNCARIALARAKITFDETTRQREELVQDVAHDLRTPLTSIKGAAQNLLDGIAGELQPDAAEYVEIVREHSDRLIGVVNWLLEAMRITGEPLTVDGGEVDLGELSHAVVHGLQPIARERGLSLNVAAPEATAYVDGGKIRQVLENLLGNALKFTERGGRIDVEVTPAAREVVIAVRDTGIGMDADEQRRIFDRYYRRKRSKGNSGLGLVIAREIVRLHGGEIRVHSERGKGSEFVLRLPRDGEALRAWSADC